MFYLAILFYSSRFSWGKRLTYFMPASPLLMCGRICVSNLRKIEGSMESITCVSVRQSRQKTVCSIFFTVYHICVTDIASSNKKLYMITTTNISICAWIWHWKHCARRVRIRTLSLCLQALIVNTTNHDCEPGLGMESFIKINNLGVPINENWPIWPCKVDVDFRNT